MQRVLILVALVALPRIYLVIFHPEVAGDSENYKNVAANILRGCGLSMSPASGLECFPHQGGQNFPGLPIYIAFVWFLFGRSDLALLLVQLGFFLGAVAWLLTVSMKFNGGGRAATIAGVLLAISPMSMPWVRFVAITEVLSLAFSIWVLAELLLSLHTGKLTSVRLAIAVTGAVFMRVENALFLLPIAATLLYTDRRAFWRSAVTFSIALAIPFVAFFVRNVSVGLPVVSSPAELYRYTVPIYPHGFLAWLDTWMTTEYQRADAIMGVWTRKYTNVLIQRSKYIPDDERAKVDVLLRQLKAHDGGAFPVEIDAQFGALARARRASQGPLVRLEIYLTRAQSLWLNPYSSYGFPIETENREHRVEILRELDQPGIGKYFRILWQYPTQLLGRGLIFGYKLMILGAFVLSLILVRRLPPVVRRVVAIVALTVIARTAVLALLGNPPQLEARYMISVVPWLEVLFAFALPTTLTPWRVRRTGL